ncbi:MAG: multiprotein bridging factor aMBF1 [Candidatus Bathyarchaeota archaeon]|nr:multiprotein bridging factor aMBF1 [Candidatus Bathyarchaeota archaeon]
MRCEVCGREIHGQPYYRVIEGGKLTVCGQCSKFSTQEWDPRAPQARKGQTRRRSAQPKPRRRSDIEAAESLELVDGYGMIIKKARQKKGLSVEDFAKQISEKESVVKKLEKENMNPPLNLVRKVQRELGINILEEAETATGTVLTRPMGPRTLGDLIKIKDNSEKEE